MTDPTAEVTRESKYLFTGGNNNTYFIVFIYTFKIYKKIHHYNIRDNDE
jgi:hypothetical protein